MTFIEADIEIEWKSAPKEEQELALLGMMILSVENYNKVSAQITEDDLAYPDRTVTNVNRISFDEKGRLASRRTRTSVRWPDYEIQSRTSFGVKSYDLLGRISEFEQGSWSNTAPTKRETHKADGIS